MTPENGRESSEEIEMGDVYQEADNVMSRHQVGMHKIKPCSRKYAFELPDVPREGDYLKAMYPYNSEQPKSITLGFIVALLIAIQSLPCRQV